LDDLWTRGDVRSALAASSIKAMAAGTDGYEDLAAFVYAWVCSLGLAGIAGGLCESNLAERTCQEANE
jgi:hypothetical protein